MKPSKNYAGIDYFRLIAALFVIAIHIGPFESYNGTLDYLFTYCLGRIAVPFFLMVTGYFVIAPYIRGGFENPHSLKKYLLKNTGLYLGATVFYLPLALYAKNLPKSIGEAFKNFFFDGTFYHLWYFPAAVMGCILLVFFLKRSFGAAAFFAMAAYIIGIFGDSYYGLIEDIPFLHFLYEGIFSFSSYTRNGIFFAPIFLLLGVFAADSKFPCPKCLLQLGCALSLCCMFLEGYLTYILNLQKHNSMYLFLIPTIYFLFRLLLTIRGKAPDWIRKSSMWIYIMHPAVIVLLRGIAKKTKLTGLLIENTLMQYLAVCLLSVILAFVIQAFCETLSGSSFPRRKNRHKPERPSGSPCTSENDAQHI